ncbi:hypothetical protein Bequi_12635 [Brachybacterium sp. JHP9]|uniref:Uncharacterized protein n=1 Tax=Brachybacterium equifaecis TaxID=2910770 RepID=A0ABT0R2Q5_9MICO|nr:hypothetical protein [Brachybacterium equifaecis]MCL6424214.1 hypothetical protein [Brachybacterium equifaecis]
MALNKKRAAKAAKKARKNAEKTAHKYGKKFSKQASNMGDEASKKTEKALSELQKLADNAGSSLADSTKDVRKKASALVDNVRPQVEDALHDSGEKIAQLTDRIGPRAEQLRHDLQDDYFPRAKKTAATTGTVLSTAVAAAVDAARHELASGQDDIRKAATKPAPKKTAKRAGTVLLVLGLAAAGAAAGYVVWKRTRPVEDPWAPPADFARAHYPASASTESDATEVSDTVGGAEAGDVASSLRTGNGDAATSNTEDRIADTTPHEVKFDSADEPRGNHRGDA